ncbi:MAG: hypothetical protein IKL82_00295 [Clostridia bacterium]|nr:hypothetical protein [Clostridia bacterium]
MGNFFKRTISFILGMIFMLVVLVGGVAGGAYWAFKNLTLEKVGVLPEEGDFGELGSWTIEDWYATIANASTNPEGFTLKTLEDNGLDLNGMFASMGVDLETANPKDVASLKNVSVITLMGGDFSNVSLGAVLPFIPNNQETGNPVVFSEGARQLLRTYTVSDILNSDPITGKPRILSILRQLPVGSLLPDAYTETLQGASYVYESTHKGLNLLGNVKLSVITDVIEGTPFDLANLLINGELKEIGEKQLREVIASFSATDDETYQNAYDGLSALGDMLVKDLYVYDEENSKFVFNMEGVMNSFTVGSLMGLTLCSEDEDCKVHTDVNDCNGELYDNEGNVAEMPGIEGDVMKNIVTMPIMSLIAGGFSLDALIDGVYLGKAFGYQIGTNGGYCNEDCATEHDHAFYWVDSEDKFVGELFNKLANVSLTGVISGNLDINGIINTTKIGDIFGYVYSETNSRWETSDGAPVPNDTINDKILYGLYGKTINDLSSGLDLAELLQGVYLGEALGYEIGAKSGYCVDGCATEHDHNFYWVDGSGKFVGELYNKLANVALSGVITGDLNLEGIVNTTKIGDIFGYVYDEVDARWETSDGTAVPNEEISDKILYALYGKTIEDLSSGLDVGSLLEDAYLGETFGYEIGAKSGYCVDGCATEHDHNFYWINADGEFVGELYNKLANQSLKGVINGTLDINGIINTTKIGDIFGYVYDDVDARWETAEGTPVSKVTVSDKVLYALYGKTVNDLSSGLNLAELLDGIVLGELLGYTKCTQTSTCPVHGANECNGKWYNGTTEVDALYNTLSNISMSGLINGTVDIEGSISGLYVGELMGYKLDGGVWKNNGVEIGEVQKMLAEITIGDILEGNLNLTSKINGLKLGDLIDAKGNKILTYLINTNTTVGGLASAVDGMEIQDVLTINPSNKVLYALIGTKVNELPNAINTLEIGKMMGYEYDADKGYWVDGLGDKVSGIEGKLAGLKVSDLSSGGIESLTFVLGDVLDESALSSGAFALIDCTGYDSVADIPVSKLSGALTSGINKATYFELVTYGIISAVNNEATLDKLFLTKKEDGAPVFTSTTESHAYWTGLTVTALMNEVVDLIGSYIS